MQYVKVKNISISKLGMGCMRLPKINSKDIESPIDEIKSIEIIRYAIDNGVNYFDTAYAYGNSEEILGKALNDGYRKKVRIAAKLPVWLVKSEEDFDKYLDEELRRLQTDSIDFYLLHGLIRDTWENVEKNNILRSMERARADGRIKYMGFSFHDTVNVFKKIIDSYNWDMCQIQLNMLDEKFQAGVEGLRYASDRNIPVFIMEPLRGGLLAENVPQDIIDKWNEFPVKRTPAAWAFRWVGNFPEASVILSGINNIEHLKEDIAIFDEVKAESISNEELEHIEQVKNMYRNKSGVRCTGCGYCMPCPSNVNIWGVFSVYNNTLGSNDKERWSKFYNNWLAENSNDASQCIECGKCEKKCPQGIEIINKLKEADKYFMQKAKRT